MKELSTSRRDFLKGAVAIGGIAATSRLPLHARGNYEQLSLAYAHIDAGAEKPFSVLHISDTHLTFANPDEDEKVQAYRRRRTELFGCRQYESLKDSAVSTISAVISAPPLVNFIVRVSPTRALRRSSPSI